MNSLLELGGMKILKDAIIGDSDDEGSPNDYVLPIVPKGYCRCQNRWISGRGFRTVRLGGW